MIAARWWKPALLAIGLISVGLMLRAVGFNDLVTRAGSGGPWAYVGIGAVACAVGVPRQAVAYAGGLALGFWPGAVLALLAEIMACIANFAWARAIGRGWAERWMRRGGRIERMERFLLGNTFGATLAIRLLPVGHNLSFNVLAGLSGVAALPFFAGSAVGFVPQTVVFALLGSGVRVAESTQIVLGAVMLVASIGLGIILLRRGRLPI